MEGARGRAYAIDGGLWMSMMNHHELDDNYMVCFSVMFTNINFPGITCAIVFTRETCSERCKSVAVGMNAMDLRRTGQISRIACMSLRIAIWRYLQRSIGSDVLATKEALLYILLIQYVHNKVYLRFARVVPLTSELKGQLVFLRKLLGWQDGLGS
ncbi:hypothetical protein Tco_0390109 [Tanacetum coccineum]